MKLELDLQSPNNPDGSPRTDLPTGEVLAWDGNRWANGTLEYVKFGVYSKKFLVLQNGAVVLTNVVRFAPLPTIIEE
jgi:hypothetical protein